MLNTKTFLLALLSTQLKTVIARGCENNPCQNGKSCYDIGEDDYECICEEFAGKHCQIRKYIIRKSLELGVIFHCRSGIFGQFDISYG